MKKLMLIGDYFNGLHEIRDVLKNNYTIYAIAFMDEHDIEDEELERIVEEDWHFIDFRDFHELTIRIMEFEPDTVLYLSYYLRNMRVHLYPELADMAIPEAFEHLRETVNIHNSHLLIISKIKGINNTVSELLSDLLLQGETMISGMGRLTIIEIGEIVDSSPYGIASWYHEQQRPTILEKFELLSVNTFAECIHKIIQAHEFGHVKITGSIETEEINKKGAFTDYKGHPKEFDLN